MALQLIRASSPTSLTKLASSVAVTLPKAVIVYGAGWCKHCKDAKAFYEKSGRAVVYHDIEQAPEREAEMVAKLKRVGRQFSSLPVIDDMGKITVGFAADPGSSKPAVPTEPNIIAMLKDPESNRPPGKPFDPRVGAALAGAGILLGWLAGGMVRRLY